MTYLSTTTVMQSVATIYGDRTGSIFTLRVCCRVDAYKYHTLHLRWSLYVQHSTCQHQRWDSLVQRWTYTIYKVYDNYVTPIVAYRSVEPRMSLAHGFRNYVVITATAWETTCQRIGPCEKPTWQGLFYILLVYKEKYISLLCERYTFSHINRI